MQSTPGITQEGDYMNDHTKNKWIARWTVRMWWLDELRMNAEVSEGILNKKPSRPKVSNFFGEQVGSTYNKPL